MSNLLHVGPSEVGRWLVDYVLVFDELVGLEVGLRGLG